MTFHTPSWEADYPLYEREAKGELRIELKRKNSKEPIRGTSRRAFKRYLKKDFKRDFKRDFQLGTSMRAFNRDLE